MQFEQFDKFIKGIQDFNKLHDDISSICSRYSRENRLGDEVSIFLPSLESECVELLSYIFDDKGEWISYFMYELDYGKKYEDGCITDENGNNIRLSNTKELYNLLLENKTE